jgi:type III secretion system HrpE/YscL family protein
MLIWSHPGGAALLAERGIVRAHEFGAVLQLDEVLSLAREQALATREGAEDEAARIVDEAGQQARRLLVAAHAEAERLREQAGAHAQAEAARGYADGQREAATQWHAQFAQLQAGHAAALAGMEERLAGIVALAVERIVCLQPREAVFARALQGVRGALREAGGARLRVHPDDAAAAHAALAADEGAQAERLPVQVEADASLAPGACIFESHLGRLDASLDVQLAGVRAALERATRMALADAAESAAAGTDEFPEPGDAGTTSYGDDATEEETIDG